MTNDYFKYYIDAFKNKCTYINPVSCIAFRITYAYNVLTYIDTLVAISMRGNKFAMLIIHFVLL